MQIKTFNKENLVDLELRRARSRALKAIENDWPSVIALVDKYNRKADNYNNLHPQYPLGHV